MPSDSPLHDLAHRPALLLGLGALILAVGAGSFLGLPFGLLTGAALVLTLVIALVWQSLQHLSGDTELTFDEALTLAAPTAAEEQKRAVLRALKDLEYERSVGKISEEDFAELSARYRAEAKRLILVVDETLQERRRKAEELLEERLRAASKAKETAPEEARSEARSEAHSTDQPATEAASGHKDEPADEPEEGRTEKPSAEPTIRTTQERTP